MAVKSEANLPKHTYDAGNELAVLRACIGDRESRKRLVRQLTSADFLAPGNAVLFASLKRLENDNLVYDPEIMRRFVREEGGELEGSYLREIERTAGVPDNLKWCVATLKWDATRARVLQGPLAQLVDMVVDPKASAELVAAKARSVGKALEVSTGGGALCNADELARSYIADLSVRVVSKKTYPIGFDIMESHLTEGMKPGRTIVVAGLSGSGKSTLMGEFLLRQARIGRHPLYCAWEMEPSSMIDVLISSVTGIALDRIVKGNLTPEEQNQLGNATKWVTANIHFMDYPFGHRRETAQSGGKYQRKESNDDRLDILEGLIAESGADLIVYDLWERLLCDLSYEGVTKALYRTQAIHKEFAVCGVIVHQLRGKDVEKRADKRPTREAIKGVGAFVEVADLILGIHREGHLKNVPDDTIELICLKQRKGRANWATRFSWHPEVCRIRGGEEVSYDPGLDSLDVIGKIKSRRGGAKPGRP